MAVSNIPGLTVDWAHPLSRGLVGWWPLNEGAGTSWNDVCGNQLQRGVASGHTWSGSALGSCITVAGAGGADITHTGALNTGATTDSYAVSLWVATTSASDASIVEKWDFVGNYPYAFRMVTGKAKFFIYDGTNAPSAVSSTSINDGKWRHIVGVRDAITDTLYVYANGALENSANDTTTTSCANTSKVGIGRRSVPNAYFTGSIAHVRIYNRALSGAEVAQLYAHPLAGARHTVSLAARTFIAIPRPPTADRLHNRGYTRIYRRGES